MDIDERLARAKDMTTGLDITCVRHPPKNNTLPTWKDSAGPLEDHPIIAGVVGAAMWIVLLLALQSLWLSW